MADEWHVIMFGCTATADQADLAEVKQQLHDQLIDMLGPARTGPVVWRWSTCRAGLRAWGDELAKPLWADVAQWCRQHPDGYLVAASAEADRAVAMGELSHG